MNTMPQPANKHGRRSIVAAGSTSRNMLTLSLLLQRFGYEVFAATTAALVIERISANQPALIIADLTLPDMSGTDLLQKLRKTQNVKPVPMVFMVPSGDAAAENRCLGYGAAGCITKPVLAEELFWIVQQIIEPKPRSCMRIGARMPVSVDDQSLDGGSSEFSIDLSEHGMRVPIDKLYPRNKRVAVRLQMKDRTITAEGSVLYCNPGNAGNSASPGMALKFVTMQPEDKEFIRKFIHDEVVRDINVALSLESADAGGT